MTVLSIFKTLVGSPKEIKCRYGSKYAKYLKLFLTFKKLAYHPNNELNIHRKYSCQP